MSSLLSLFKANWLSLMLVVFAYFLVAYSGYLVASKHYKTEIAELKTDHANAEKDWEKERRTVTENYNKALQFEIEKFQHSSAENQRLTSELLNAEHALTTTQQQLKRSIFDATKKDGAIYSGLGPDSLRIYIAALGYTTSDNQHMSADTRGTSANEGKARTTPNGKP